MSNDFNFSKASWHWGVHTNGVSFLVSRYMLRNPAVCADKPSVEVAETKKGGYPLHRFAHLVITATFSGSTSMPSVVMTKPKYLVRCTRNSHLRMLAWSPESRSRYSTGLTCSLCSSRVLL